MPRGTAAPRFPQSLMRGGTLKPVCHHIISCKPHNPLKHVSGPILYRRNPSPEKLRNLPEVTQLGHSRVRLLTDGRGKAREDGAGNSGVTECAPHPLAPYHFSACCQLPGINTPPSRCPQGHGREMEIKSPAPRSLRLPEPRHPSGAAGTPAAPSDNLLINTPSPPCPTSPPLLPLPESLTSRSASGII